MASMDKDPEIVLAEAEGTFWLVSGDQHLDQMLADASGYPVPVGIIRFPSKQAFARECGPDLPIQGLWQVHPKVVDRLRGDQQVIEIVAPA